MRTLIDITSEVRIYIDLDQLSLEAAREFTRLADIAIDRYGCFNVALAGGSTPRELYKRLAKHVLLDWGRIHLFWGDERCVPPDHPESNYGMVKSILLDHIPIPPGNIHRMQGEIAPEEAAVEYQVQIANHFRTPGNAPPAFDLILLGMGVDGHTASLFPGSPALDETERWVLNVNHTQPPPPQLPRLTFTLPLINTAWNVVFMVTGINKAETVHRILLKRELLPARLVNPEFSQPVWMLDSDAAVDLITREGDCRY
jgi:6-phosphogluconolactonase